MQSSSSHHRYRHDTAASQRYHEVKSSAPLLESPEINTKDIRAVDHQNMPGKLRSTTSIDSKDATKFFQPGIILGETVGTQNTTCIARHWPIEENQSILLSLPAEIRGDIYESLLLLTDSDLAILLASRRIYMEASAMLWPRPVSFASQAKLFSWIERSAQADLRRVRTLTLRLTDVDLASLIDMSPGKRHRPSAWGLYQQDLERLSDALQNLPGLVDLTIIPCDRNGSQLLNGMYMSFLGMIPVHLPRLKQLTIHDCESVMVKVPSLRQLHKVVFDGNRRTSSSPSGISPTSRGKRRVDVIKHEDSMPIKMEVCEMDQI